MTQISDDHRRQIERLLGRALQPLELKPVSSISDLSSEQVAVVKALAQVQLVSALDYMRAVVPSALTMTLTKLISTYA